MQSEITVMDAMTAVAKQLPDDGITFREFITRSVRLQGHPEPEDVVEKVMKLAEEDGYLPDDIVTIGPAGTRIN